MTYSQQILNGYLEAIQFTDCGPDDEDRQAAPWSDDLIDVARSQVSEFVMRTPSQMLHGINPEQIGHDLWLTRNGHGAGFWDRGLGDRGDSLTAICKALGEVCTYVGDDGHLHITEGRANDI